jgi:UbiA prenyltransferase family
MIPSPANRRGLAPESSAQRSAMPHSSSPWASTNLTGPLYRLRCMPSSSRMTSSAAPVGEPQTAAVRCRRACKLQDERIVAVAAAAAVPVGLLATAILVVNNLRDLDTDGRTGKRTLAVRLGERRAKALYRTLVVGAFVLLGPVASVADSAWPLLALGALPPALRVLRCVQGARSPGSLVPALALTARVQLLFGILLAVALWAA